MIQFRHLFFLLILTIIIGCKSDDSEVLPDISDQQVKLNWVRYDKELLKLDEDKPLASYNRLLIKYPQLTDLYFKKLMQVYHPNPDSLKARLQIFISDGRINDLGQKVNIAFPDTDQLENNLTEALKYYQHYFPGKPLPRFYTLFTEYGYPTFIFDDADQRDGIGIGLDLFLGKNYDYKSINPTDPVFSDYITRTYDKEYLVKKTMEMIIQDAIGPPPGKRFIDRMINQGKKIYLLKKVLPTTPDSIIYEYTSSQMAWMNASELQVWDYYLSEELMYETNHLKLSKFLNPAPSTQGMPESAPGRTTDYIGYKIVDAYMKRQTDNTMADLINMQDSQLLLEQSRYKPKRKAK